MNKISKFIIVFSFVLIIFAFNITNIYCNNLGDGFNYGNIPTDQSDQEAINRVSVPIKRVWGTVLFVMQILSVAGIIFMGVRYMFASADQKADLKKSTIYLIMGIIIIFAFSTFIQFIINATNEVISTY